MPGLEMEERQVKVTLKKRIAARKNKNDGGESCSDLTDACALKAY